MRFFILPTVGHRHVCEIEVFCPNGLQRFRLCDVGAFIERQTNQQQKAKLEKQMYNTLFVSPNIAKPMLCVRLLSRRWH